MSSDKSILVTGATGNQGRAVVRHLLQHGFKVRALTRSPEKPAALALKAQGVEIAYGNLEDLPSLRRALDGVNGIFSTQDYWAKGVGLEGEIRQGSNLVEAATGANVTHFVHSSVVGCDRAPQLPHIAAKWQVEKRVDAAGLPRTFLRSVFFMENFLDPQTGPLVFPVLAGSLEPAQPLHLITVDDIGWFAAQAFANPQRYLGETLDLAGDCLTVAQMKAIYLKVTGKRPLGFNVPRWLFRLVYPAVADQFAWNNQGGWDVARDALRSIHPGLVNFETFLERNRASLR